MRRYYVAVALCVASLAAGCAAAPTLPSGGPTYECRKAVDPIRLDGVLDEDSWKQAEAVPLRYAYPSGERVETPAGLARMCWDARNFYVALEVPDINIQAEGRDRDTVGEALPNDLAEIFVDINGDDRHFFEFHVNPLNGFTDTLVILCEPDSPLGQRSVYGDVVYLREFNLKSYKTAVKVYGEVNHPELPDEKWVVEMALPFESLLMPYPESQKGWPLWRKYPKPHPDLGDVWRIQTVVQNYDLPQRYYTWVPTRTTHFAQGIREFGRVKFAGPPTPQAPAGR